MPEFEIETAAAWIYTRRTSHRYGLIVPWERAPEITKNDFRKEAAELLEQLVSFQQYKVRRQDSRVQAQIYDPLTQELKVGGRAPA